MDIPNLTVLVVSSSQLGAKEKDIANVMGLIAGDEVRHFWDGERRAGAAVQPFWEELGSPAWDMWLLYPPGVTWGADAPEPAWWEHQLGGLDKIYPDRRLDAERFARKAQELARP